MSYEEPLLRAYALADLLISSPPSVDERLDGGPTADDRLGGVPTLNGASLSDELSAASTSRIADPGTA